MNYKHIQAASPKESMHSELLMHMEGHEITIVDATSHPHFEFATWLTLKNTRHLPAILLLEYNDNAQQYWQIIDIATIRFKEGVVLLTGVVDLDVKQMNTMSIYLCHPSAALVCDIEEFRLNNQLLVGDYLEIANVA